MIALKMFPHKLTYINMALGGFQYATKNAMLFPQGAGSSTDGDKIDGVRMAESDRH